MTKTILITGASRGIGAAAARLAGARGWAAGVNYAGDAAAAGRTVAAVEQAGGKAVAIKGDVASDADIAAMFDATEQAFGALDGVVINAGVLFEVSKLADVSTDRLRRGFDVNILGATLTAREAARRMSTGRGGKGGSVVIVSSTAARLGTPNERIDYAVTKGAVDSLMIGMSKELGPEGIRVNAVRPGLILTDIHASGGQPGRAEKLGVDTPLGRAGTADEVGEAIVWLLDDASSYVTGSFLEVSGGR